MKILLHDDGKGKAISFEASLDYSYPDTAYGETKEEAIEQLRNNVLQLIEKLKKLDYDDILMVDCFGGPTK